MASIIKSNTYADFNGREILTANNDGALTTQKILYPAFDVNLSSNQTGLTDSADNLVNFNEEKFDTDNAFDTSTGNHKFTVPSGKAGKYCFYSGIVANPNADNQTQEAILKLFKNGATYRYTRARYNTTYRARYAPITLTTTMDLAVGDYIQIYFYGDDTNSAHTLLAGQCFFGGYRIGS